MSQEDCSFDEWFWFWWRFFGVRIGRENESPGDMSEDDINN